MKHTRIDRTTFFLRRCYTTHMALESSRLAELKYAISAVWDIRKKLRLSIAQNLNEISPRSKSVLPCEARLPQLEVWDNLKQEQKAYSKGGLLFRENWAKAQRIIIWRSSIENQKCTESADQPGHTAVLVVKTFLIGEPYIIDVQSHPREPNRAFGRM